MDDKSEKNDPVEFWQNSSNSGAENLYFRPVARIVFTARHHASTERGYEIAYRPSVCL